MSISNSSNSLFLLVLALAALTSTQCLDYPETVPYPTEVCIKTQHHTWAIPHATVYIKYHSDTFPGYDKKGDFYDASFVTGADGRGCIASVPPGKHWLVAFGYDSLYFPHDVFGSLPFEIDLQDQPVIDTILYVSE